MIYISLLLGLLGLVCGSFVGALVWRLKEKRDWISDRSECEHCHHKLTVIDLIPVASWLALGGKCRYCRHPIGIETLLVEFLTGVLFVVSYLWWPENLTSWAAIVDFAFWLVFIVFLAALFLYDVRWYMLPDKLTYPLIALGLIDGLIKITWIHSIHGPHTLLDLLYGLLPIGGLYGLLFFISNGKWVGLGDAKLGIFIGLVLGWQGALLTMLLANFIGVLVVLPGLLSRKLSRNSRVPFGPFLIAGFWLAGLAGPYVIDWYMGSYLLLL